MSSVSETFSASTISDFCSKIMRPFAHKITIATELAAKHLHTRNNYKKSLQANLHICFYRVAFVLLQTLHEALDVRFSQQSL
jgi:hypothetical protein